MANFFRAFKIISVCLALCCCTSYQPTKNVWKGTKDLWANYVSPAASVDYEDKGEMAPQIQSLANAMIGVDRQLSSLERVMHNADKPPTLQWMERLFQNFPWLSGFAGVKYDGTILGQEPADSLKNLDFNYLLYEDSKQRSRALRADVQPSELGPEIMLAAPLYDGIDFLGIVVTYFDMRQLMGYSETPDDIVVLCPTALLWPGKYDFAATPLAGVDWKKVVRESSAGTCTNSTGTFAYMVRYLANLPLIFAVPQKGDFPLGNGGIEQGFAFFPKERERATPPPVSEERIKREAEAKQRIPAFEQPESQIEAADAEMAQQRMAEPGPSPNDLEAGSRESVLLKKSSAPGRRVEERDLEGENVPVERVQRPRRRPAPELIEPDTGGFPEPETAEIRRPSPFGPAEEPPAAQRPSPFGPREEEAPAAITRPGPFGPPAADVRNETEANESAAGEAAGTEAPRTVESPASPYENHAPTAEDLQKPDATEAGTAPQQEVIPAQEATPAAESEKVEQQRPALLPGGRPSPFGPR